MKSMIMSIFLSVSMLLAEEAVSYPFTEMQDKSGMQIFQSICAQCHGENGEGKFELRSPSIAAMPKWYAVHQLKKFKQGLRGAMPEDTSGYMMHNTAKNLDDDMIEKVSDYLLKLKPVEIQNTLNGNPVNGKWMFQDYCMGCHRYNASGELVFGSPPLYHLQDWYLKAQMQKFSHKLRGSHPSDLKGAKMVDVMAILPFPNATDDILAYIATLTQREKKK